MKKISEIQFDYVHGALKDKVTRAVAGTKTFEDASQKLVDMFYEEFKDSLSLVRLFVTVPFDHLPPFQKKFVSNLAQKKGMGKELKGDTLVLTLAGTRGAKPEWNSVQKSQGHVGIPLISSQFLGEIPMMSRLLQSIGVNLNWFDEQDTKIVIKKVASLSGVFYVGDAQTEIDSMSRKIISAQEFVKENNIKTVFGLGGAYLNKAFATMICFTKENVPKNIPELLISLMSFFKKDTAEFILKEKIFNP